MYRGKFDLSIWFTNTDSHGERKNKKNYRRIILVKSHKILQSGLANLTEEQCMTSVRVCCRVDDMMHGVKFYF